MRNWLRALWKADPVMFVVDSVSLAILITLLVMI